MNGVELVAGSRPTRRSSSGNIEPSVQPMTTMATTVSPMVGAIPETSPAM